MKQEVLFVLLPHFADREPAILAEGLNWGFHMWESRYAVKTVGLTKDAIPSLGGFRVLPDYTVDSAPGDFAALILIGGTHWRGTEAEKVLPLLDRAVAGNRIIGAICDASRFLAARGYVNEVEHTSNDPDSIKTTPGSRYTGGHLYRNRQSVRSGAVVTANGTAYVEFARDVLLALEAAPQDRIAELCRVCKEGWQPDQPSLP